MAGRKLTPEQVEEIRKLKQDLDRQGKTFVYSKVAKEYGVAGPTIRRHIAPNENDLKPRPAAKYDPEAAKKRRGGQRSYQFYAYKNSPDDIRIIEKMESTENKQRYIKDLILADIKSSEE